MSLERLQELHGQILALADHAKPAPPTSTPIPSSEDLRQVLQSQLLSRHMDRVALELRGGGCGFYTICSAGHEANALVGRLTRPSDPALLHYRSAALFIERSRTAPELDPAEAIALGLTASADDPISGGRHKVFGSLPMGILPQTSTIGSHIPKAVGLALALDRAHRLALAPRIGGLPIPDDAVVVCSLGDASLNHASTTTALNAAGWVTHQGLPLPLLIVCEDNGLGISVRSPGGWSEAVLRRTGFEYHAARSWEPAEVFSATEAAVASCRTRRRPTLLHLRCTRLLGHSGADPDTVYRDRGELSRSAARDPVLATARLALAVGALDGPGLRALDERMRARADRAGAAAHARPKLQTRAAVMAALPPARPDEVAAEARRADFEPARAPAYGDAGLPEVRGPQPMGRLLNWALHEMMAKYPQSLLFGQDVADKGGIYNITAGLWKTLGPARVFNTLLDETTILALAQGAGLAGLLPIPDVQYLAFLHNAEDQLRGEAATTAFFSNGQLGAPMVLRVGAYGYQKGFGGHFHNDNSIAVLRDIPGLLIATPGCGADAVAMLRTCFAVALREQRPVVWLEPIALYNRRDLLDEGDGFYLGGYPPPGTAIAVGEIGHHPQDDDDDEDDAGRAPDLTLVSYGNGLRIALQAQRVLRRQSGIRATVLDLRWLSPLPIQAVLEAALPGGRLLVVDECRRAGNVGEGLVSALACDPRGRHLQLGLVTAAESPVPLGEAAELVLVSLDEVLAAATALVGV